MNANDLTFGIEIETIAPDSAVRNDGLRIGPYKHGIQVPYLPQGWKAEADGSINNSSGGHKCEIVSPVLRGDEGLAQVGRGPRDARSQRPPGQRELRGPRSRRLEARLAERGLGPLGHDRRLRREGPLRDHRQQEPRARDVSAAGSASTATTSGPKTRPRPQPLPRLEPDQPRPRDEGHGRVPRLLGNAQARRRSSAGFRSAWAWSSGPWPASGCRPGARSP